VAAVLGKLTDRTRGWLLLALILGGVLDLTMTLGGVVRENGFMGFPLDDPWIHLQFAKNLHDYGSFSYFGTQMKTAGSTSPLYTMLLAAGFFLTRDEMMLSYLLGMVAYVAGAVFLVLCARRMFPSRPWFPLAGATMFLLQAHMQYAALTGMETSLFVAGVLACFWLYLDERWTLLGVATGVLVWVRPDALLLAGILGVAGLWAVGRETSRSSFVVAAWRKFRWPAVFFVVLCAGYFAFNWWLSGSILPNTFAAKLRYYGSRNPQYFSDVASMMAGTYMLPAAVLAAFGAATAVLQPIRRARPVALPMLLWFTGLILAYGKMLPHIYQNGRYLMPAIPALILLALTGLDGTARLLERALPERSRRLALTWFPIVVVILVLARFQAGDAPAREKYQDLCRYIHERQVRAAFWMRDHLPEDAVVATHDIGAIGFYSGRRLVDLAGLVSPDMVPALHHPHLLPAMLAARKVTHIAVLRSWYEIDNVDPLFQTDPAEPEVMEIFALNSPGLHFVPGDVVTAVDSGVGLWRKGDVSRAEKYLKNAVRADPESSRALYTLAMVERGLGERTEAISHLTDAIRLYPSFSEAKRSLAALTGEAQLRAVP
jgi:tetratricopeptide (TPR) repeat protein